MTQNVGRGTIEIVDTAPPSRVTMTLHMLEPFETRNTVDFLKTLAEKTP